MLTSHSVGHFEIPADSTGELKGFYSSLFGWQFEKGQTEDYWMIKNAGISGGIAPKENLEQMPTMFISVESIENYIDKAKQLGAKVIKDKQEIDAGYYAVLEDPQRNTRSVARQAMILSGPFFLLAKESCSGIPF
jgi:predicted enzyme related to lactoylglutathione lyase